MIGLLGVVFALVLLIWLAYRGISVLLLGPLMALLATLFAAGTPLMASYTQLFMGSAGQFIIQYFPLFLLGAIFGKLMDDSGSAEAISQTIVGHLGSERAILAVVLACAVLTYGGVSLFVVAFAVYPIAAALFRQADIPKRLVPATIALGAFTFTMTALPGTPAIQNAIPMPHFGTTPFAAPFLGIITALVMFGLGQWWLSRQAKLAKGVGEGYGAHEDQPVSFDKTQRELSAGEGFDVTLIEPDIKASGLPPFALAIAPVVLVIVLNYFLSTHLIPRLDTQYLAEPIYGSTSLDAVRGIWAIIASLTFASLLLIGMNWRRLGELRRTLDDGANASVLPIFNTASLVGFGAVIAALPAFDIIKGFVDDLGGGNPLVSLALSVNVLAGVTGSASGGMSIALQTLGAEYLALANQLGISPDLLHRVTTVATGGLDSLPHNGAVVTLLAICGLTHREAYKDIFMVAVVFPILSLVLLVVLGSLFGAF
ncbi:GntP family permease [Nitrincola tibetensis]|uniref:GntP family permease n=1 Tax=Nitrincola tibetensis TaxID=2219697 RepID=A0A364NQL3_9GAMM|nr:GntP family permease [Nitrincola tibetensis]RAU19398.1 GntP family permease [Nitrincola tibetensis]